MTLAELTPDTALKALLDGLQIQTDETAFVDVKVYSQGELPNVGLDDAFVYIDLNGMIENVTEPIGLFKGNLAVSINIKCYDDGTINKVQLKQLVRQLEERCFYKTSQNVFFEPYMFSVITPTTTNMTTGYATTVLNIAWHTTIA